MSKPIDLLGKKFNRLTVISKLPSVNGTRKYLCRCACGKETTALSNSLRSGDKQSCGCLHSEISSANAIKNFTKHGKYGTSEHRAWVSMKTRCYNENCQYYRIYGGRGIHVCDRWLHSFENFLADMGLKPSLKHSIDRIENDLHYSCGHCQECLANNWPSNCRWATNIEQQNNRSFCYMIEFNGKVQNLMSWSNELKIKYDILRQRIRKLKWPIEKAFSVPAHFRKKSYGVKSSTEKL